MEPIIDLLAKVKPTFWKKGRLDTFENWPFQADDNECNPERMASAGFYCIGTTEEPDLVECFICTKQLDGWDSDDDPWSEHEKHQPFCPFVKLNKQDEMLWTIAELYHLLFESIKKELLQETKLEVNQIKEHMKDLEKQIPQIYKEIRKSRKNP